MKRFAIFFTICALFGCKSKSREDIVKEKIINHLFKTMHDYNSYEPVEFGKLDSLFTAFGNSTRYDSLNSFLTTYLKQSKEAADNASRVQFSNAYMFNYYINDSQHYNDLADSIINLIKLENGRFKPQFVGYKELHSFRGRNMNGATILTTEYFILDSALNVVSTEDFPEQTDK